ncbi:hypothetical protein PWR66_05515 [Paraburkholderia sp. A1RO-5]|uniref:BPSL0761 family protein n=1 Tax=Paraburkholderia sp. A1RO-5 TaxID=3028369 RepID=UPI003B7A60DF
MNPEDSDGEWHERVWHTERPAMIDSLHATRKRDWRYGSGGKPCTRFSDERKTFTYLKAHLKMTTPHERTRAVVQTREFLEKLASGGAPIDHQKVQDEAIRLLRHYPLDFDLEISSTALPSVWASLRG